MAASLKAMAEDKSNPHVKKTTQFQADPTVVQERPGFNKRDYSAPDVVSQIEGFARSYEQKIFVPAWVVWVGDDGEIIVLEGHLRRRGALLAIERGASVPFVDCVQFRGTWAEAIRLMLLSQEGLKFKPLEYALGVLDLKNEGLSNADIATQIGRTAARVEQYLLLASAGDEIHELVRNGQVEADTAIIALRTHKENALAVLTGTLEEVKGQGGTKVTRKALSGPSLPPKVLTSVMGSLQSAISALDQATRVKLAEWESLPAEQLKGKKIEVDAESLLALLKAQQEIDEVRQKREEAAAAKVAASAQQQLSIDTPDSEPQSSGEAPAQPASADAPPARVFTDGEVERMKVFAGATFRNGAQVRTIVATYTQRDAAKLAGVPLGEMRTTWSMTGNPVEVAAAKAHPEVVLVASSLSGADFQPRS